MSKKLKNVKLRKNTATKYKNGTRWKMKRDGWLEIIGRVDKKDARGRYVYHLYEFDDGTEVIACYSCIRGERKTHKGWKFKIKEEE